MTYDEHPARPVHLSWLDWVCTAKMVNTRCVLEQWVHLDAPSIVHI